MKLRSGHTVSPADPELVSRLQANTSGYPDGAVLLNPGKITVPRTLIDHIDDLLDFKVDEKDVFVISYPKSGSTWTQEIVWAMTHNPNLDHPEADTGSYTRCPYYATPVIFKDENTPLILKKFRSTAKNPLDVYENYERPRVFKTHLHFSLMSPDVLSNARVVYVIRDPREAFVSYYHFSKAIRVLAFTNSLEESLDDYLKGNCYPGSYVYHLKQWWPLRNHPNVHTIFYENLKKDTMGELRRLSKFLELDLTEQQLKNVMFYSSFSEMKKRDPIENSKELRDDLMSQEGTAFFRKGEAGKGKEELSPEHWKRISEHFKKELGDVILPYDFDN